MSKVQDLMKFKRAIIPFALVGYEIGYSKLDAICVLAIYHLTSNKHS